MTWGEQHSGRGKKQQRKYKGLCIPMLKGDSQQGRRKERQLEEQFSLHKN
jgi:hypothetical protein